MKTGREIIAAPSRTDWNIGGLVFITDGPRSLG
jgi:hypothetical protein